VGAAVGLELYAGDEFDADVGEGLGFFEGFVGEEEYDEDDDVHRGGEFTVTG